MHRGRRPVALFSALLVSFGLFAGALPASAEEPPTVRLFAAKSQVTAERDRYGFVWVDPGAWIASAGGAFELRATRPDYETPIALEQVDAETGAVLRSFSPDQLEGWYGLRGFLKVSVRDPDGKLVLRESQPFCPNGWYRARMDDEGPNISSYPYMCGGNPLTRGMVWGIDDRWAVNLLGDWGIGFQGPLGAYTVRVWIDPAWVGLLGIAPEEAETTVQVNVVPRGGRATSPEGPSTSQAPGPLVATITDPPAESLPDLIALPAWGINTYHRRGHDFLAFNATEWNAGPGTLVAEGFRPVDADEMDAFQYFYVDGEPVGRHPIGKMEFHAARGHYHWHFQEFTEYSLLDAASGLVQVSGKQSWCLANTDAIDLSVPNANWGAYGGDLSTMCGGPGALWIREILDVGWGDTYSQYVAGQAFDITDLPNGRYQIKVHVNPTGSIMEGSSDNNVELRTIRLRGKPGNRWVVVPPWNGIDTEIWCPYCF